MKFIKWILYIVAMLFVLLMASCVGCAVKAAFAQEAKSYAMPLEKWNGFDGEGRTGTSYNLAVKLIDSLAADTSIVINGFALNLHNNFSYLGEDAKSRDLRSREEVLRAQIEENGWEYIAQGPAMAKNRALASLESIPITWGARRGQMIFSADTADARGYCELRRLRDELNALPEYTMARVVYTVQGLGGWVYLNHADDSHINKWQSMSLSLNRQPYIALRGVECDRVFYRGRSGDIVRVLALILNDAKADEIDADSNWVGNDRSGFLHCRTPDLTERDNIWRTARSLDLFPQSTLLCVADEINSPIGHSPEFKAMYPAGWPQAWAWFTELIAYEAQRITAQKPMIFQTDPRIDAEQLRHNRESAPVPDSMSANYLDYLQPDLPARFVVWAETNRVSDWQKIIAQTDKFQERRIIAIYAGAVNVDSVFAAVGDRINEFDYSVFWWNREQAHAFPTLRAVTRKLRGAQYDSH